MDRYQRQLLVPEIGILGQKTLATGKVAIIGVGGLGCPAALYLAGAGVGNLGLFDFDKINLSNLHRQILFREQDISFNKAHVAKSHLRSRNSDVYIKSYAEKITSDNIYALLEAYDIIIDGGDNFILTYLLNDYAYATQKPFISSSVRETQGYIGVFCYSTFLKQQIPCLRTIFPDIPAEKQDGKIGITGPSAGIMGSLLAQECLKVLLQDPHQLAGKLLSLNLWNYQQKIIEII